MSDPTKCEHCGAKLVEYKFGFNKGLAVFLIALYRKKVPCRTDDLGLDYSVRTNSQKLRYWGLARPFNNKNAAIGHRRGWWHITGKGILFVEGRERIQKFAVMLRNELQRFEGPEILIGDVDDVYQHYGDFLDQIRVQQRELFA
jgi:hypothetical protein